MNGVSIIIPAYNEVERIEGTLSALQKLRECQADGHKWELIVVDDGSGDRTGEKAAGMADRVISHRSNLGKGAAMHSGINVAKGKIVVFLDADLGASAVHVTKLLEPIWAEKADMAVAILPGGVGKSGFGWVKAVARFGIFKLTGFRSRAPLSGQRAIRREAIRCLPRFAKRFGVEVGMTIDMFKMGCRVVEIEVPFCHRETGRNIKGFYHRGKQFVQVTSTLLARWRIL